MSPDRPRVLMLSKACIVGIYQRKLEAIACLGVDLLALVPPSWKDERGETRLERVYTEGYRLEVLPIALNGSFHLHWYPGLGARLRDFQPDIVHIDEEPYNLAAWQALVHARRAAARTLFFSWQNLARRYPPPFAWGERWLLRTVDYALMGTDGAAQTWRDKGYSGRLAVVPQFGVDPDLFHPPSPTHSDPASSTQSSVLSPQSFSSPSTQSSVLSPQSFTIAYIGRLVPEKGVDVLLRAASRLGGDWRLRVIGSGPERDRLCALAAELSIGARVEWIDWAASTDMPAHYRQIDVLALPSLTRPNWKEQFGRVLIEAMASGVAVVGSDSGAIPDILGDGGLIVPEGDVAALAEALTELQSNPARQAALGAAGRARVLAHFTHEQVAADTVRVYRQLLE